jgi:hypothetical protein
MAEDRRTPAVRPRPSNGEAGGLMRPLTMLIVAAIALVVSVAVWYATGGHFVFFALPLLFGLPLLGRRRR